MFKRIFVCLIGVSFLCVFSARASSKLDIKSEDYSADSVAVKENVKLKINSLLIDSELWLKSKVQENFRVTKELVEDVNSRNVFEKAAPIKLQVRYANEFIKKVDEYQDYLDNEMAILLKPLGVVRVSELPWLFQENIGYLKFREKCEREIERLKQFVETFCRSIDDEDLCKYRFDKVYIR